MDDVIKRLVEVDRECANKVKEALEKKKNAQSNMSSKRNDIYNEYIEKQQGTIEEHKTKLLDQNEQEAMNHEKEYNETIKKIDSLYNENKDKWVSQIIERCIK